MAAYQFPDNELQEINALVSKITGDYMGLNQLYNPDETHTAAGEHAIQILKSLQAIQEELNNNGTADKLLAAIISHNREINSVLMHPEDSNPLLSQVVNKSLNIVKGIMDDPDLRVALRQSIVLSQKKQHNDLLFPLQATKEINELIENTIKELQSKNPTRSSPAAEPPKQKTFFSKFFSSPSNKIMDSSQIQRIPQAELETTILFLKELATRLPNPGFASTQLQGTLKRTISDLKKYIDESPPNASPFIHNDLSKLTSGLQDYSLYINDPERELTKNIDATLRAYVAQEFDNFIQTPAGKHYYFVASGNEQLSPHKTGLNNDEIENFRDVDFEGRNKLEIMLTVLPEDQFADFCEKLADAYERNYDALFEESTAAVILKNSGPRP